MYQIYKLVAVDSAFTRHFQNKHDDDFNFKNCFSYIQCKLKFSACTTLLNNIAW